jgi:hypothetical protein
MAAVAHITSDHIGIIVDDLPAIAGSLAADNYVRGPKESWSR